MDVPGALEPLARHLMLLTTVLTSTLVQAVLLLPLGPSDTSKVGSFVRSVLENETEHDPFRAHIQVNTWAQLPRAGLIAEDGDRREVDIRPMRETPQLKRHQGCNRRSMVTAWPSEAMAYVSGGRRRRSNRGSPAGATVCDGPTENVLGDYSCSMLDGKTSRFHDRLDLEHSVHRIELIRPVLR